MQSTLFNGRAWGRSLALAAVILAPLSTGTTPAHAARPIRVVACELSSLADAARPAAKPTKPIADNETNDQVEEDQLPKISGTILKPSGTSEDDSKALTQYLNQLTVPVVSSADALQHAQDALANPDGRTFNTPKVEGENGFLVWSVETKLRAGVAGADKELEVKVDAGGSGEVLSIECD